MTPDQFKLVFALWTRQAVQELIQIRFGINRSFLWPSYHQFFDFIVNSGAARIATRLGPIELTGH